MSGKKKSRNQDVAVKLILLVTALLNLVRALIDFISKLTE